VSMLKGSVAVDGSGFKSKKLLVVVCYLTTWLIAKTIRRPL